MCERGSSTFSLRYLFYHVFCGLFIFLCYYFVSAYLGKQWCLPEQMIPSRGRWQWSMEVPSEHWHQYIAKYWKKSHVYWAVLELLRSYIWRCSVLLAWTDFFLLILLSTVNPHSNTLPLVKLFKANPLCPYGQCNSSVVSTRFECRPEWDPSVCMFSLYWHWLILPGPRLAGWSWSPDTLWWLLIAPNSVNEFPYGDQQRISYPPSTQPAFLCNLCS